MRNAKIQGSQAHGQPSARTSNRTSRSVPPPLPVMPWLQRWSEPLCKLMSSNNEGIQILVRHPSHGRFVGIFRAGRWSESGHHSDQDHRWQSAGLVEAIGPGLCHLCGFRFSSFGFARLCDCYNLNEREGTIEQIPGHISTSQSVLLKLTTILPSSAIWLDVTIPIYITGGTQRGRAS